MPTNPYTPQEVERINQAREANVNAGVSAYSGAGVTPFSASQGLGVINSETLSGSAKPVTTPPVPTSTAAAELGAYSTSVGEQDKERAKLQAEQDAKVQEDTRVANEEKGKIRSLYDQALGIISGRGEAEKEAGLDVKAQKVTEYTNQMEALDRAETNAYRALEGSGLTDVQRAANQREIQRKFAFQKADVALLLSAANRDYETAFNIVNRKIELSLEPIKFQLDYTKQFYEDAKADLTKSEDRAFNLKIAELDRQHEETKALEKYKGDISLEAVKNGVPIPSYVQSEINGAKNQAEVNQVLARNGISLAKPEKEKAITASRVSQVLDGFTKLSDLTTAESQKVVDKLFSMGFNSDTPPAWFKKFIESELRQSILPSALQEEWIKYRDGILSTRESDEGEINFDDL